MKKNNAFRRAAALMAALSITVSLAAPAFAGTYYIDNGDITVTKNADGSQTVEQNGTSNNDSDEIIITTTGAAITTLESDLEGPAAEDTDFGPVVEDNYQPAQPEDAEKPEGADQPESTEKSEDADRQESADQQAAPAAAAPAASIPKNDKGNGFWGNTITVINNCVDKVLNLTLKDVKIDVSDTGGQTGIPEKAALSVQGKGNVEIELDGDNVLKSATNKAGLEKNESDSTGMLTLKDDKDVGNGSLKAEGGGAAAGIGGDSHKNTKNITITGGTVEAVGGSGGGAGIGGGYRGSGKNIIINGGAVTATTTGGESGAGIGGGSGGDGRDIFIISGTVKATGGKYGAGIGGGKNSDADTITISGGTVTAQGGENGAGIGGGNAGSGMGITIEGGTVTAAGGDNGAGIGGGDGEDIAISNGTVNATGGIHGAGIGGGRGGSGSDVTVSGAAQVTANAGKGGDQYGPGATIGNGGTSNRDSEGAFLPGEEIDADITGLTPGYIHHVIYNEDGTVKREWWEPESARPTPDVPADPNVPEEESNEVDMGTPWIHVETLEGDLLPFDARQQGSTLRVTTDTLSARLHGTRQALEALREQGVEQIEFVTSLKTTTLSVAELLAEGGSRFALEHNGFAGRLLSAAQAESVKCRMMG